jgi:TPR repeat protein
MYSRDFELRDFARIAFEWYKKSAEQEYSKAQNQLGCIYYMGEGTEKNLEEAAHWFQKAANNGDYIAQYNLGECYELGKRF